MIQQGSGQEVPVIPYAVTCWMMCAKTFPNHWLMYGQENGFQLLILQCHLNIQNKNKKNFRDDFWQLLHYVSAGTVEDNKPDCQHLTT